MARADGASPSDASLDRTHRAKATLFGAPRPAVTLPAIVALGALAGLLVLPSTPTRGVLVGVVLVGVPNLAAALVGWAWHRVTGGTAYLRRTALLAVIGAGFAVGVASVAALGRPLLVVRPDLLLVLAAATPLWLRAQAVPATLQSDDARALPDILGPFALTLVLLPLLLPVGPTTWGLAAVAGAASFLGGWGVVAGMRAAADEDFEADLISLLRATLEHITGDGEGGRDELEAFFDDQATEIEAQVGVLTLHGDEGPEVAVAVPRVHPGPYGTLGGSDLPARLDDEIDLPVVTLHGTCSHDQNPATRADADRVVDAVRDLIGDGDPVGEAAPPVRLPEDVVVQPVGDGVVAMHAPSPSRWDDVDVAIGALADDAARDAGAEAVLVADAHHCTEPGTRSVRVPLARADEIVEATGQATAKALEGERGPLRVGLAHRRGFDLDDGVGPAGVACLVFEAGDHRTAYLVMDGNNAVPGLRETVRDRLLEQVDEAEVATTDTHIVNLGLDGFNPVGRGVDPATWADLAAELVEEAEQDLSAASASYAETTVTIRAFGAGTADRIATLIHMSTTAAGRMMQATLAGSLALGAAATVIAQLLI